MLWAKLGVLVAIANLWYWGGQHKGKKYRTIWIPILLGLTLSIVKQEWWLSIVMFVVAQSFRIGYGNYMGDGKDCWLANLLKDRNGWWIRGAWGCLVGLALSYPFGFSLWYVLTTTIVSFLASRLKITLPWADYLVGASIALIVFV